MSPESFTAKDAKEFTAKGAKFAKEIENKWNAVELRPSTLGTKRLATLFKISLRPSRPLR
jgi:hypothetical protein